MIQPFWIKKNPEGKYTVVRGKEAVSESNKARDWTERKVGQIFAPMNTAGAFAGGALKEGNLKGGVESVKQLYKEGRSPSIGPEVMQKFGVSGFPAMVGAMALEVGMPEFSDIADISKAGQIANKFSQTGDIAKIDDVSKSYFTKLDTNPYSKQILGPHYEEVISAIPKTVNDPKAAPLINKLIVSMQDATKLTPDIQNRLNKFLDKAGISDYVVKGDKVVRKTIADYGMSHRPMESGAIASDITGKGKFIPEDFYTHPEYYADMSNPTYQQSWSALQRIKDRPDATVTIYRASPSDSLNVGDWVTLSKKYANESMEGVETVHSFKVKAKDIQFAGDDINEFGFYPTNNKPIIPSAEDVISKLESHKKYIQKKGSIPNDADIAGFQKSSEYGKYGTSIRDQTSSYYEYISNLIDRLKKK